MIITSLSVQNVRSHDTRRIELSDTVTVITGRNGIGKTTLLEAIYIALQGSSFKGVDKDIILTNYHVEDCFIDDLELSLK